MKEDKKCKCGVGNHHDAEFCWKCAEAFPASSCALECECTNWERIQGLLATHHENCKHHDLRGDAIKQLTALVRGIEEWASDEDGIHPACWEAYCRAKTSIGEFDWATVENAPAHGRDSNPLKLWMTQKNLKTSGAR